MFAIFIAITFGAVFAGQTAINAQLRRFVVSPFLASTISFFVGLVFLTILLLVSGLSIAIPVDLFLTQPVYIWLGGILGAVALTVNILLFPKLGSIQTTIMPILGMTLMSMVIDHYAWFHSIQNTFGLNRAVGVLLLLAGVFLAVVKGKSTLHQSLTGRNKMIFQWLWRLLGVLAGMLLALQFAINGELGKVLQSPTHAAFVSFFVGTITLLIMVGVIDRSYANVKKAMRESAPWWVWIGGILGSFYILTNVYLVDQIGTGQTVVLVLFGQIAGSLLVEQFGLFRSYKHQIMPVQLIGLTVMIVGVFLIRLF